MSPSKFFRAEVVLKPTSSSSSSSSSSIEIDLLNEELTLPCGVVLRNRLGKAAMTETLADPELNLPTKEHLELYKTWNQEAQLGLVLTGNVMIDKRYREGPRNVVLDAETGRDPQKMDIFRSWALSITSPTPNLKDNSKNTRALAIMQISHPGRQSPMSVTSKPIGPSSLPLSLETKELSSLFRPPRSMSSSEIQEVHDRFLTTSLLAQTSGFDGIQIHSAHGYLLSQFLSPKVNCERNDSYGGQTLQNRKRLLLQVVASIRAQTRADFVVSVKLNSSDFQKGGFAPDEAFQVLRELHALKVDFVEISGGSYEKGAMMGSTSSEEEQPPASTREREAYFLEFARKAREEVPGLIIMVTGGFRSRSGMASALSKTEGNGTDIIGIARPLAIDPTCTRHLLLGTIDRLPEVDIIIELKGKRVKSMEGGLHSSWHQLQMWRIGEGKKPQTGKSLTTLIWLMTLGVVRHFVWDYGPTVRRTLNWTSGTLLVFGLVLLGSIWLKK